MHSIQLYLGLFHHRTVVALEALPGRPALATSFPHRLSAFPGGHREAPDSGIYCPLAAPHPHDSSHFRSVLRTITSNSFSRRRQGLSACCESSTKACPHCRLSQKVTQNTQSQVPHLRLIHQGVFRAGAVGMGGSPQPSLPRA